MMVNSTSTGSAPIFIIGNSRSGTTMMGRILGNHDAVFTLHELHFFEQLWSPKDRDRSLSWDEAMRLAARLFCIQHDGYLTQGNTNRFSDEAETLITSIQTSTLTSAVIFEGFLHFQAVRNGKRIACEHTPGNIFYIGEILTLYPEARMINMIRDPRDVLLSQKRKWKRRFLGAKTIPLKEVFRAWINYNPVTISKLWNASINAADSYTTEPRLYSLRFEDLLAEPEETVRRICDFLGLAFRDNLLEVPQVGSSHVMDHPEGKGIRREMAGSWQRNGQLSSSEIFLCQRLTRTSMETHGYHAGSVHPNPGRLICDILSFPIKLVLAFLFNFTRMRHVADTIRRRLA